MFEQFSTSFNNLYEKLSTWLNEIVLALPNIILATLVLVISIFIARYLRKVATKTLHRITDNETVIGVISNITVTLFMILALFVVLNILNLSEAVTALLGTAGVIGLAVGLALQDPLINLFSGVLMSVRDFYKVGDLIESNGHFGEIQQITLRTTIILTPDGQQVVLPNKEVVQNPLINFSHNGRRRVDISCGVSYGDDLEKAKSVAIKAINDAKLNIPPSQEVQFFYNEFGDSSINFSLRFWKNISTQAEYLEAKNKAIIAIKKAFDKNNISIPFPITTLDFGVSGGLRIDDIYPKKSLTPTNGIS